MFDELDDVTVWIVSIKNFSPTHSRDLVSRLNALRNHVFKQCCNISGFKCHKYQAIWTIILPQAFELNLLNGAYLKAQCRLAAAFAQAKRFAIKFPGVF